MPPSAWLLFRHHLLYGSPRFRQLSSEWSTWAGVLLSVSRCIKSGLAKAQHPGEAHSPLILDMSPCQTDTVGAEGERRRRRAWHSSAVCQGLQHMIVLAIVSPFFLFFFFADTCTVMATSTSHTHTCCRRQRERESAQQTRRNWKCLFALYPQLLEWRTQTERRG